MIPYLVFSLYTIIICSAATIQLNALLNRAIAAPNPKKSAKKKLKKKLGRCRESYISASHNLRFWPFSESILTNFPMLQPFDFSYMHSSHHQQQNVENRSSKFDLEPILWDFENCRNTCRKFIFIIIFIIFNPRLDFLQENYRDSACEVRLFYKRT